MIKKYKDNIVPLPAQPGLNEQLPAPYLNKTVSSPKIQSSSLEMGQVTGPVTSIRIRTGTAR